ncbi:MAG: hypothetical protein Ct9H300mP19_00770 [Dehalococcoidia bacterium]|nr:MAG: hypothetical protein Ct9H300mP19_00770 [Dehalococcoidia bacterium]
MPKAASASTSSRLASASVSELRFSSQGHCREVSETILQKGLIAEAEKQTCLSWRPYFCELAIWEMPQAFGWASGKF